MDVIETFNRLDTDMINAFISDGQEEHLHLDFKTVQNSELGHANDRKNLAKCVSGFGNSSGGIIVWGVATAKNSDKVDCASAPVLIANVKLFVTRLNSLIGEAVSPIVGGVQHKALPLNGNQGFAATLVPESDSGPHMAKCHEDRYYKRSGDSFYRMEHFDLEDMFGRRQRPDLRLEIERDVLTSDGNEQLTLFFLNTGRAVARHSGFLLIFQDNVELTSVGGNLKNISGINSGRPVISYIGDHTVIHPNSIRTHLGRVVLKNKVAGSSLSATGSIYCENMRAKPLQLNLQPVPVISLTPPELTDDLEVAGPTRPKE